MRGKKTVLEKQQLHPQCINHDSNSKRPTSIKKNGFVQILNRGMPFPFTLI
jgi:hypothetical protein